VTASLNRLWRDARGVTVLEFAFILPPMLFLLMGAGEVMYQVYLQSLLDGAIQKAGRDSAIQGGANKTADLDTAVLQMVRVVAKTATIQSSVRKSYADFAKMKPERFDDTNGNNAYNSGECFDDINGNRTWDADPGLVGQGGANDVTSYTLTISYTRLFPVAAILGWGQTHQLVATTLLKNQPYASQAVRATARINCP
jgi:Flp pilus assembly protein TadG